MITNVKVSSKSKRFFGISKKRICLAVKKLIDDEDFKKSKYFKDKKQASQYRKKMTEKMFELIKNK